MRVEVLNTEDGFSIRDVGIGRENDSVSREKTQGKAGQRPGYSNALYLSVKNEYDSTSVKVPVHLIPKENLSWLIYQAQRDSMGNPNRQRGKNLLQGRRLL
jgi:hypothetical protein